MRLTVEMKQCPNKVRKYVHARASACSCIISFWGPVWVLCVCRCACACVLDPILQLMLFMSIPVRAHTKSQVWVTVAGQHGKTGQWEKKTDNVMTNQKDGCDVTSYPYVKPAFLKCSNAKHNDCYQQLLLLLLSRALELMTARRHIVAFSSFCVFIAIV